MNTHHTVFAQLALLFTFAFINHAEASNSSDVDAPNFQRDNKPVWEVGLGGGFSGGLDYPASASRNSRTLFLPYAIYRGKTVRVGSGRVKAVAVEQPSFSLDLSIGAAFNADSEDNEVREGMPDLDFLFEIGPRLELRLFDRAVSTHSRSKLAWENYLRAVASTDFSRLDGRGWRVGSHLRYSYTNVAGKPVDFLARFGPIWASEELQAYFYEVDERFATDTRPVFNTGGGYLGSELFYGVSIRPMKNLRIILGSTLGFYDAAENRDSPLFESRRTVSYAAVMIWSIWQSTERINLFEED